METIELGKNTYDYFEEFRFVLQARATEETKKALQKLNIENDCCVATDGQRLHVAYMNHNYATGIYEVIKATKTQILLLPVTEVTNFPKWRATIPHYSQYFELASSDLFIPEALGVLGRCGVSLNYKFLLPFCESERNWQVFYNEPDRPVRFISYKKHYNHSSRLEAIIMPLTNNMNSIKCWTKSERRKKVS